MIHQAQVQIHGEVPIQKNYEDGLNDSSDSKSWRSSEPKRDSISSWNSDQKSDSSSKYGLNDSSSSKPLMISSSYDSKVSNSNDLFKSTRMDNSMNNYGERRNFELDTNSGMGLGTSDPTPNSFKDSKTNSWLDSDSKSDSKTLDSSDAKKSFWE